MCPKFRTISSLVVMLVAAAQAAPQALITEATLLHKSRESTYYTAEIYGALHFVDILDFQSWHTNGYVDGTADLVIPNGTLLFTSMEGNGVAAYFRGYDDPGFTQYWFFSGGYTQRVLIRQKSTDYGQLFDPVTLFKDELAVFDFGSLTLHVVAARDAAPRTIKLNVTPRDYIGAQVVSTAKCWYVALYENIVDNGYFPVVKLYRIDRFDPSLQQQIHLDLVEFDIRYPKELLGVLEMDIAGSRLVLKYGLHPPALYEDYYILLDTEDDRVLAKVEALQVSARPKLIGNKFLYQDISTDLSALDLATSKTETLIPNSGAHINSVWPVDGNGVLCELADAASAQRRLIWSDGTLEGTVTIDDAYIENDDGGFSLRQDAFYYAGHSYFIAGVPDGGTQIWRTDGTPDGTRSISDIQFELPSNSSLRGPVTPDSSLRRFGARVLFSSGALGSAIGGVYAADLPPIHSADTNASGRIELSELLRGIQLYQADGYHTENKTEDGFAPGAGVCADNKHHSSDYAPADGKIALPEILRLIQLYQDPTGAYGHSKSSEDGFTL